MNKLSREGREEQADNTAVIISRLIVQNKSMALAGVKDTDTEKLWALLKQMVTGALVNKQAFMVATQMK